MSSAAVIFDLDGVLADSEPVHLAAEQATLADYGFDFTEHDKLEFVGRSNAEIITGLIARYGLAVEPAVLADHKARYLRDLLPAMKGFAATTDLVRRLREAGVPIAVASGSTPQNIVTSLSVVGLLDAFEVRVSADEVAAGKPAPDVFLEAAARLGVRAEDCVVVEDAVPGVLAARAAGMRCVAIPTITEPLDPAFFTAGLLFPRGMASVDVDAVMDFIAAGHAQVPASA